MYQQFLETLYPSGPWVLMAIDPTKKEPTVTKTLRTSKEVLKFVNNYNKRWNIYYHLNQANRNLTRKAAKRDIATVHYLHVDLDARPDAELNSELSRIEALLHIPPLGVLPPTAIIYSGGGYQALWKLEKPIFIGGKEDAAEEAERYTRRLQELLEGDNTHNVDRIFRLPGTWNVPDEKKKAKGRKLVESQLISFNDSTYSLNQFEKAAPLNNTQSTTTSKQHATPITKGKRVDDMELFAKEYQLPQRLQIVIAQGKDPETPLDTEDQSRSAWLFYAICNLLRCDVPTDTVYAIITDPDWKISESILDKGKGIERYAQRQIQNGVDFVASSPNDIRSSNQSDDPQHEPNKTTPILDQKDALKIMNGKFSCILHHAGQFVIVHKQYDPELKREQLQYSTVNHFMNGHRQIKVKIPSPDPTKPDGYVPLGKWWLDNFYRKQFDSIVFMPNQNPPGMYNLWQGFSYEPKETVPTHQLLYLKHIFNNICQKNEEHYTYLLGWMANAIQNPGEPGFVAPVLKGKRGTGKGVFAACFGDLLRQHYLTVSNAAHLTGQFNGHLQDCVILFADEAFFAGDKKHESVLKTLITEDRVMYEKKGKDSVLGRNCIHLLVASNSDWVVPSGPYERRFFVLDVGEEKIQDSNYFKAIKEQHYNGGGAESLLHYLMNYDLSDFTVQDVPKTEALREQVERSYSPEYTWWFDKLEAGRVVEINSQWPQQLPTEELVQDYIEYCNNFNVRQRLSRKSLGNFLHKVCPDIEAKQVRIEGRRTRTYFFPSLEVARESWEKLAGKFKYTWINETTIDQQEAF